MIVHTIHPNMYAGLPKEKQILVRKGRLTDNPDTIIERTCESLNISKENFLSRTRTRNLVEARCIAVGLIHQTRPDIILTVIGELIGGKHYSSVIHMIKLFGDLSLNDKKFKEKLYKVLETV